MSGIGVGIPCHCDLAAQAKQLSAATQKYQDAVVECCKMSQSLFKSGLLEPTHVEHAFRQIRDLGLDEFCFRLLNRMLVALKSSTLFCWEGWLACT